MRASAEVQSSMPGTGWTVLRTGTQSYPRPVAQLLSWIVAESEPPAVQPCKVAGFRWRPDDFGQPFGEERYE